MKLYLSDNAIGIFTYHEKSESGMAFVIMLNYHIYILEQLN